MRSRPPERRNSPALSGEATVVPKTQGSLVESIRVLRVAFTSARKHRTQVALQLRDIIVTAPDVLRGILESFSTAERVARCTRFHHRGDLADRQEPARVDLDLNFTAALYASTRSVRRGHATMTPARVIEHATAEILHGLLPTQWLRSNARAAPHMMSAFNVKRAAHRDRPARRCRFGKQPLSWCHSRFLVLGLGCYRLIR